MKVKQESIRVRISKRILWVGSQAYPLSMAVRVHMVSLRLKRTGVLLQFGRRAGATIAVAAIGVFAMACVGRAVPVPLWVAFWLVAGGFLIFHTAQAVRLLRLPKVYVLRVAMAGGGSDHAAVVSSDEAQIQDLTTQVTDAIDNPAAEYEIRVENLEFISGDKVGGDKVLGDKTIFAGSN